jgi:hypothetical protein
VARAGTGLSYESFNKLTAFAQAAWQCDPNFLEERGFPQKYEAEIAEVLLDAESEAEFDPDTNDPAELRSFAERADSIASSLDRLGGLSGKHESEADDVAHRLRRRSTSLENEAAANESQEPDGDSYPVEEGERSTGSPTPPPIFDISMLFSEL